MYKEPAEFLDKILNILAKELGNSLNFIDVMNRIYPVMIGKEQIEMNNIIESEKEIFLKEAINYLIDLELVDEKGNEYGITYKGYIKIKLRSFSKENKHERFDKNLNRIALILSTLSIIISILAFLLKVNMC